MHPDICHYPAARRANDIERGSEPLLRRLETTHGVMPPHYSCESKPVPANANIFISNIGNTMQTSVYVDARGLGHGLSPEDCQDIAVSACEEAVDQFFSRQPFQRPPAIHCKPVTAIHCD
jgi:hypothetical protein